MRLLYTKTGTGDDSAMAGLSAAPTDAQRVQVDDSIPSGYPAAGGLVLVIVPVDSSGDPLEAGSMTFDVQAYRTFKVDSGAWVGSECGNVLTSATPYVDIRIDDFESPSNAEVALRFTNIASEPVGYAAIQVYGQEVA